jgi:hypothetical protein
MAVRTQADLIQQILENLQIVPQGQAPEQDDVDRVEKNLPSLLSELAGREILYVPDIENIDDTIFLSLAKIAAYELRRTFGTTGELEATLRGMNQEGIDNIRVIRRGRPTYEPVKTLSY